VHEDTLKDGDPRRSLIPLPSPRSEEGIRVNSRKISGGKRARGGKLTAFFKSIYSKRREEGDRIVQEERDRDKNENS